MNTHRGFTLIELMMGLAVVAILATAAALGMSHAVQSAYFLDLKDTASRLAIAQQNHRQVFNQFAPQVAAAGTVSSNQLVFPDASRYRVRVLTRGYNEFEAELEPRAGTPAPSDECFIVRVRSQQGIIAFQSFDRTHQQNTTTVCLQNG